MGESARAAGARKRKRAPSGAWTRQALAKVEAPQLAPLTGQNKLRRLKAERERKRARWAEAEAEKRRK